MESLETIIARAALAMELAEEDLRAIFGQGAQQTYEAGAWLFHESTPRDWAGIIQDGEIEIMRGLHGSTTMLALSILPLACFANRPVRVRITGGVFQDFAPSPYHLHHGDE